MQYKFKCFVLGGMVEKLHSQNQFPRVFFLQACAPYFKWNAVEGQDESGITPVGNCHIAAMSFGTYTEYSPCRSYKTEQFYKGHNYSK